MRRAENVELTTLCLITKGEEILLQERRKKDWPGYTMPGGHVEPGESIVDSVIREMKEETGLTIRNPKLCGIKQFPIEGGRYLVFLFKTSEFEGEAASSEEGFVRWVHKDELSTLPLVEDFHELLRVMVEDGLNEFQYLVEGDNWEVVVK